MDKRWIWNLDEVHFKVSDAVRTAWALPNEQPEIPDRPVQGLKTCSVIAAACVRTSIQSTCRGGCAGRACLASLRSPTPLSMGPGPCGSI